MATPGQAVFGRYMIFNIVSVVDWWAITTVNQRQVDIDNVLYENWRVAHEYAISNLVYAEMAEIYYKLDYKKQGPYTITELFINGKIRVKRLQVNKQIYIR